MEKSANGAAAKGATESLAGVDRTKGAVAKDHTKGIDPDHLTKGIVEENQTEGVSTSASGTLPEVFLKALGVHECHCPVCDPGYHQNMKNKAKEEAEKAYNSSQWKDEWKAAERVKILQEVKAEMREKERIAREVYMQYTL